jgi:hypothetical protein
MKKILSIILILLAGISIIADEQQITEELYQVTAETLNVRQKPNKHSEIKGKLQKGDIVNVTKIQNGWAEIWYKCYNAYVNEKFITPYTPPQIEPEKEETHSWVPRFTLGDIDVNKYANGKGKWLIYLILGLAVTMFGAKDSEEQEGLLGIFVITCPIILYYLLRLGKHAHWFCMPNQVGWLWAIVGFVALGFVTLALTIAYSKAMRYIRETAGDFSLAIGWKSWIYCSIPAVIASIFEWETWCFWLAIILGICQIIQIIRIFQGVIPEKGIIAAIAIIILYFLGLITITALMLQFVSLLIVVLLIGGFIYGAATTSIGGSSSRNPSENIPTYPKEGYIDVDGKRIYGRFNTDSTFENDLTGDRYDSSMGGWNKRE